VSDLPGVVVARTSRAVYGSVHERTLLIPPGSLLLGRYEADVRPGERRLFVSFGRIETPGGASVRLAGMEASGDRGGAGLHDLVRTHFWRMFGASFLVAGLGAALPGSSERVLVLPSGAPLVAGTAAGEALDQTVGTLLSRDRDLPPTLIIRRGTRFDVLVARTIRFPPPAPRTPTRRSRENGW
jgi:type IV secretory pathway VirB10-like protein